MQRLICLKLYQRTQASSLIMDQVCTQDLMSALKTLIYTSGAFD